MPETPVLDEILHAAMAYIAERYVPGGWEEGSDSDPEAVWDRALEVSVGPAELWDGYDEAGDLEAWTKTLSAQEAVFVSRVAAATLEVLSILTEPGVVMETCSPKFWAYHAFDLDKGPRPVNPASVVCTYLYNVNGGVMDATFAFHQLLDDDE